MQTAVRVVLTIVLLVAAGFLSYDMASYYLYSPWTRDARVRADVVSVAPDVSGYIDDIRVQNDQFVHKGDLLFVEDQPAIGSRLPTRKQGSKRAARSIRCCVPNMNGARSSTRE